MQQSGWPVLSTPPLVHHWYTRKLQNCYPSVFWDDRTLSCTWNSEVYNMKRMGNVQSYEVLLCCWPPFQTHNLFLTNYDCEVVSNPGGWHMYRIFWSFLHNNISWILLKGREKLNNTMKQKDDGNFNTNSRMLSSEASSWVLKGLHLLTEVIQ